MGKILMAALAFVAALPAWSQTPVAGKEYRDIRQNYDKTVGDLVVAPEEKGKIEVVEFFAYFCAPCYRMTPQIEAWRKRLGPDVFYKRVPMAFNSRHLPYAQMYYTLKVLKKDEALHEKVYHGLLVQKVKLDTREEQAQFFETLGIQKTSYIYAGPSANVFMKGEIAAELNKAYDYHAVPAIGVGGRYVTWLGLAKTPEELLGTADYLIGKARAEQPRR
jgi:thiol:disulfide interchange protein DsbA